MFFHVTERRSETAEDFFHKFLSDFKVHDWSMTVMNLAKRSLKRVRNEISSRWNIWQQRLNGSYEKTHFVKYSLTFKCFHLQIICSEMSFGAKGKARRKKAIGALLVVYLLEYKIMGHLFYFPLSVRGNSSKVQIPILPSTNQDI